MAAQGRFFDDLARMASGAVGSLAGARGEVEEIVRLRIERVLARMDLVSRDEFDAVKELAASARREADDLKARIESLEGKKSTTVKTTKPTSRKKST